MVLRREGRLYKAAGLTVRRHGRRKLRVARAPRPMLVSRPNERWSMDFVSDYLANGRRFPTLNIIDAFTRECLAIEVDFSLPSTRVVRALNALIWTYGVPESLHVGKGPEFISKALDLWASQHA